MRRTRLGLTLCTVMVAMLVAFAPAAVANDRNHFCDVFNCNNRFDFNDGFDFDDGFSQSNEQEADSGDVDQSFDVSGGGENSNQCVGIQGVANTGNAQNQTSVLQYGSDVDDFDFEDSGASIEVSPEASTTCDQQVNQAASAFGK
jgi:hypothetical protein